MLVKLLLAFILVPLIELFLLVWIAEQTSLLATVALVIVTGVIGSLLARRQGLEAWHRFRRATTEGRLPTREIQDGLFIAFAAALLLTPGILTDVVGFLLLTPAFRRVVRHALARRMASSFRVHMTTRTSGWSAQSTGRGAPSDDRPSRRASPSSRDTIDAEGVRPVSPR